MYSRGSSLSLASSGFFIDLTELVAILLSSSWSGISLASVDSFAEFLAGSLSSIGFSGFDESTSYGLSEGSALSLLAVTAVIGTDSGLMVCASSLAKISKLSSAARISGSVLGS